MIVIEDTIEIKAEDLKPGDRVVKPHYKTGELIVDERLTGGGGVHKACGGRHFTVIGARTVCYQPCAWVRVMK